MADGPKALSQSDIDALIQQADSGEPLALDGEDDETDSLSLDSIKDKPLVLDAAEPPPPQPAAVKPSPVQPSLVKPSAVSQVKIDETPSTPGAAASTDEKKGFLARIMSPLSSVLSREKKDKPTPSPKPSAKASTDKKVKDVSSGEKKGLLARINPLSSIFSRGKKAEAETVIDPVTDLQQRLGKLESVCDRLNPIQVDDGPIPPILERLKRIEATLETLCEPEEDEEPIDVDDILRRLENLDNAAGPRGELTETMQTLEGYIRKLNGRIETISANLQDTMGYGIHKHFQCRSCGTRGNVAFTIRCTQCGNEGYQGWWPEQPQPPQEPQQPQQTA